MPGSGHGSGQEVIVEPEEDLTSPARRGCFNLFSSGHRPHPSPSPKPKKSIVSYFKQSLFPRKDPADQQLLAAEGSEAEVASISPQGLNSPQNLTATATGSSQNNGAAAEEPLLDLPPAKSKSLSLQPLGPAAAGKLPSDFDVLSRKNLSGKEGGMESGPPVGNGDGTEGGEPHVRLERLSPSVPPQHNADAVRNNFIGGKLDTELPPVRRGKSGFFRTDISATSKQLLEADPTEAVKPPPPLPPSRSSFKPPPQGWAGAESVKRPGSARPQSGRPASKRPQSSKSRGPKYRRAAKENSSVLHGAMSLPADATPMLGGGVAARPASGRPGSSRASLRPGSARPESRLAANGSSRIQLL